MVDRALAGIIGICTNVQAIFQAQSTCGNPALAIGALTRHKIDMSRVDSLSAELAARLQGRNLIVFDGECVFCSAFFRFMLRHDQHESFSYTTAQSPLGQGLYAALNLPLTEFETNLVVVDGVIYQRLDAFAAAMAQLGYPWRVLVLCCYLPIWLKDAIYKPIARNRYRIFGRYDTCMIPDATLRARFLV